MLTVHPGLLVFSHLPLRASAVSLVFKAYHLRREETDWFDKPREPPLENGPAFDRRLPDKLAHSRPPSQHQDQVRRLFFFNQEYCLRKSISRKLNSPVISQQNITGFGSSFQWFSHLPAPKRINLKCFD